MTLSGGKEAMDIKENLRQATDEEAKMISSWGESKCKKIRLAILPAMLFFLIAYVLIFVVNALFIHSIFITVMTIILLLISAFFFGVLFFVLAPNTVKLISKGAYKVLSGRVTDKRESENRSDSRSAVVVFEDEKGNSLSVSVNQANYKEIRTGSCLLLKWDDPKISGYRIIMTDRDQARSRRDL